MIQHDYTDERGRQYRVLLPAGVPESEIDKGIPVGPPDVVDSLGLPEPLATRIHNKLFEKQIWNATEARKQPNVLQGILRSALMLDVHRLMEAFVDLDRP